ncbi:MAG: hypothetical protein ACE5E5_10060 [Phycisphaerae bacterium]
MWWTHAIGDTFDPLPDPEHEARAIIETGGGVLLLHCHHKEAARRDFVLEFTEHLLGNAAQQNIEVVPLIRIMNSQSLERAVDAA